MHNNNTLKENEHGIAGQLEKINAEDNRIQCRVSGKVTTNTINTIIDH